MAFNRYNLTFSFLLLFHFFILTYLTNSFSISFYEADIYFNQSGILNFLVTFSTSVLGQNDFALRLPFVLFYLGSAIILYLLTDDYFKYKWDRVIAISIFMALPGVNSAALLVNESIIVIFCTLLYLYLYKLYQKEHYILLFLFLFIDNSFAILFLALFFYSLKKKDNVLLSVSLILFGISMSFYGFEIGGKPKGYFLDTFGVYASIFSPLMFLYFFYALYRVGIKLEKDMYWYISMTALFLSLLFSLRQKVAIEDFAPFVVISIPIMVKLFLHSLRVRLSVFRKYHYIFSSVVLGVLVINFSLFILNKYIYLLLQNPQKHFAYKYHIAKELAAELKKRDIDSVHSYDKQLQLRLRFYGIEKGIDNFITPNYSQSKHPTIDVIYHGKTVTKYNLLK